MTRGDVPGFPPLRTLARRRVSSRHPPSRDACPSRFSSVLHGANHAHTSNPWALHSLLLRVQVDGLYSIPLDLPDKLYCLRKSVCLLNCLGLATSYLGSSTSLMRSTPAIPIWRRAASGTGAGSLKQEMKVRSSLPQRGKPLLRQPLRPRGAAAPFRTRFLSLATPNVELTLFASTDYSLADVTDSSR